MDIGTKIAVIGLIGIAAQWGAWRFNLPAIVLLALGGVLIGPVSGFLVPAIDFGQLLQPMVKAAVAIILFEGGLNLRLSGLGDGAPAVRRLVVITGPLVWGLSSAAGHYVGGLTWGTATIIGAILVVTGPTVIAPLLRQARLSHRPSTVLQWEGIVNDPIGAMFAVITFEVLVAKADGIDRWVVLAELGLAILAAAALGVALGKAATRAFRDGLIPEYLKAPALLVLVLVIFEAANQLSDEAGLIAVTVMGFTIGNSRFASLDSIRHFKENVNILLISGLFLILSATLTMETVQSLSWHHAAFIGLVMVMVRPAAVWVGTIGSGLDWQERLLIGWIAPRGIVAVAISGLFGAELVAKGQADAELLGPLAFAIVFATVLVHGFSIRPLAYWLGLSSTAPPGVLVVGATPWSICLCEALAEMDIPVMLADRDWRRLSPARHAGLPTYHGEILSELIEHQLELHRFGSLIAASEDDSYNTLVCTNLGGVIGRSKVFQVGEHDRDEGDPKRVSFTLGGRAIPLPEEWKGKAEAAIAAGWRFRKTRLTEKFAMDDLNSQIGGNCLTIAVKHDGGRLELAPMTTRPSPKSGSIVLTFGPKEISKRPD